ncbi:MAG: DNA-binding transcriptional LysR family regulator [bacterium]|jgi:DNA-binding transcriptional LysR family regulator
MSNVEGIEEFIAVVDNGNFSEAARKLKVSNSHISRQISALEKRLQVNLIKRTTRKMTLTPDGELYYQKCKVLFEGLLEANRVVQGGQISPKGLIRVTGAGDFFTRQVVPVIADFAIAFPEIQLELDVSGKYIDLIEEHCDLAVRTGKLKDSSLIARKLIAHSMIICASPEYLKQQGIPKTPDDLKNHHCLITMSDRWRLSFPDGIREVKVQGRWKCNSGVAQIEASCKGLGLTYLSEYLVQEKIKSGELVTVLDSYVVRDISSWLVYPQRDHQAIRVQLLIDYLLKYFRKLEKQSNKSSV